MVQHAKPAAEADELIEIILDEKERLDDPEEKHPPRLRKVGTDYVKPRYLRRTSEVIVTR